MDYEKKYKDALEQAKKELATCGSMDCDAARLIFRLFPQLRESEDDRIRKWLITQLEINYKGNYWASRAIEYLEKQKAQKPAEWSNTDKIGWDEAFACVTRAEKSAKNEEELQNAVTAEKWLKEIKFKYYVHPVKQEWSEKDEEMLNNIIEHLKVAYCACSWLPETLIWLKSLKKRFSYQTK